MSPPPVPPPAGAPPDPARDRAITRRGLAVLAWLCAAALLTSVLAEAMGLRTATAPAWPTDVHAFVQRPADAPDPDVVILGSSRASFGMNPASFDACLQGGLGRPTTTVNLARTFATADSFARTWRTLLDRPDHQPPAALILAIGPEALDDRNPMLPARLSQDVPLAELPAALGGVTSFAELRALLRPPVRGVESLVRVVFQRHRSDPRLRWLMLHHGGGQWCEGGGACTRQNAANARVANRWERIDAAFFERLPAERFAAYTIDEGRVHDQLEALLARTAAVGTKVLIVRLPLHDDFRGAVPPEAFAAFVAETDRLAAAHDHVALFDAHKPQVTRDRRAWIDPDHLGPRVSQRLSREICRATLLPLLQDAPAGGD